MSLNDFTNTRIKDWLQIGATDVVVKNLTIVNSINIDPNIVLENVAVDNLYVFNDLVVKTDEGTFYNLKTPTNGNAGNVLQTDGAGGTFWGTGSSGGSGIIYNGILPIPAGQHITINSIGTEVFKSKLNESATNLDVDGLNITNANDIYANQIRNISGNVLNFNTDDNITILNNQALLSTKTIFTLNNELVSKEYVDNAIPPSSNPTYQQIYNNSTPADTNLIVGKNIVFKDSLGNVIVGIIENGAKLSAPNIICDDVETTDYLSINDELQKIDNFGTSAPNTTNIQGNTITDELTTNLLVSKTFPATFVDLNNSGSFDVYGSDFTYNGFDVITTNTLPPSSNPTYQDIYNNSPNPALTTLLDGKNIRYIGEDGGDLVMEIDGDFGSVRMPIIETNQIRKQNALLDNILVVGVGLTANNFTKSGGNSSQYLMADGSTTAISAIGSNIYLYKFSDNTTPPPTSGHIRFNNNTLLSSVSNVYISHITNNSIDIDPFFISIQTNNILYIQHTTLSTEWIKFTITAEPTITPENFISIPVSLLGNGTFNPPSNIFTNNTDIYFSIFSSTATTNPFNQSLNTTDNVVFNSISSSLNTGILQFNELYPKTLNDLNIGTLNTSLLRLGGDGVFLEFGNLVGLNNVSSTKISSNTLEPLTGDVIDILGDTAMKTDRTTFTENQEFITKSYVDNQVGAITLTTSGTGAPILNDNTNPSFSIRSLKSTAGNDRIDIAIGGTGGSEITLTNPNPSTLINVSSVGSGFALVSGTNPNYQVKSLSQGTGITLNSTGPDLAIINSSPASSTTITSTDNNLLPITGTSPNFSITPKYTYMLTFGGNNNNTSSQWLQYGTLRTASPSGTNAATFQAIIPISSTLVWASIIRTTTTGTCSVGYSISGGTVVVVSPSLLPGQASNPTPYALNSIIPANGNLGVSVLSSVLSGNCLVSFLLRSN
jgi:hypothetical protein